MRLQGIGENKSPNTDLEAVKPEEEEWIPGEAFATAQQFRAKHGNDLTPELITKLLSNLNKIWMDREKKQISRIKKSTSEEITQLKRQLVSRMPYDALQSKKVISRLTSELNANKKELQKLQKQKTNLN